MSAVDVAFAKQRAAGRKAFIPFVTAGDPDLAFTCQVLRLLAARGATVCEVGIPYSDPIADGPVIQASYTRALAHHIRVHDIFKAIRAVAPDLGAPLVCMVSFAIVLRHGLTKFVDQAQAAGFSGAIVPDLLVEESQELAAYCRQRDFSLIQLITPTTPRERAAEIAKASSGFVYYVSVTGITGERATLPETLLDEVRWLRTQTSTPVCIGFGISQPDHVRALAPAADGLIVGSAIVKRLAEAGHRPREAVLQELAQFVDGLLAAFVS